MGKDEKDRELFERTMERHIRHHAPDETEHPQPNSEGNAPEESGVGWRLPADEPAAAKLQDPEEIFARAHFGPAPQQRPSADQEVPIETDADDEILVGEADMFDPKDQVEGKDDDDDDSGEEEAAPETSEKRKREPRAPIRSEMEDTAGSDPGQLGPPSSSGSRDHKRQRMSSVQQLRQFLQKVEVKKVIDELEEDGARRLKFRAGNHRQRRTINQEESSNKVSEMYSLPRITEMAKSLNIPAGFALDITVNQEDGTPWDLSVSENQAKAKRLEEEKPELLVASPMCAAFSSWMSVNYSKMDDEAVREHLAKALAHLKFRLELCLIQHQAGRLFLLEHPVAATSWGSRMMRAMAKLNGV